MKKKVIILGNCVANRLQEMVASWPLAEHEIVLAPMIHLLREPSEWEALAAKALGCDIILTQPLFSFGPCNTQALRDALSPDQALVLFPSPSFDAYFPDSILLRRPANPLFPALLDWDSSIIFSCYAKGISIFRVEGIYLDHKIFHGSAVMEGIARSLQTYAKREAGLDIQTILYILGNYAKTRLFHSPMHPVDALLDLLKTAFGRVLGLQAPEALPALPGFGFNQWPLITRHHALFHFPGQEYFVIGGQQTSIEDVAMAYYNFYEFHPEMMEWNRDKIIDL